MDLTATRRKPGPKPRLVSPVSVKLWIDGPLVEEVDRIADARRITRSEVIRLATAQWVGANRETR